MAQIATSSVRFSGDGGVEPVFWTVGTRLPVMGPASSARWSASWLSELSSEEGCYS